jgi:hypothetical protein
MMGAGILVYFNTRTVPNITNIFNIGAVLATPILSKDISLERYKVEATMIPTTAALIPIIAR